MASAEISESVQHAITPAECKDRYYPGEGNTDLQCFPTLVDNRYYFTLQSANQGATNTINFNPDQGLSDIVLNVSLPAPVAGGANYAGWSFPRGWLAAMVTQCAVRIGGSSLYYFTSDQMFIDTLMECEDSGKKQALMNYAGAELLGTLDFTKPSNLAASLYIKMPWNTPAWSSKGLPLPTDLLTQPIQLLLTFGNFADVAVWYGSGAPTTGSLPTAFAQASMNFRKTTVQNSEHLLSRRENMLEKALTFPLKYFPQTTFKTTLNNVSPEARNQLNVVGFRSGSIKELICWSRPMANGAVVPGGQWNCIPFKSVKLLINGLVMYDTQNYNGGVWSICDRNTPCQVDTTVLRANSANSASLAAPSTMNWTLIPLGQQIQSLPYESSVSLGYPIQNSVVNLEVVFDADALNGVSQIEVSVAAHYTCSLVATKNTMEYVF